ncbi:MAG: hypothetical protein IKQ60_00115 [Candidatus Methanomethylophilaceae archaeon]|nr:hypothetical protein [Candidatus Methanomethylophilaceae archaeon]
MALTSMSPGNSSIQIKKQAEACLEHLESNGSVLKDSYANMVDNLRTGKEGFLALTFDDELKDTGVSSEGMPLLEYITSEAGRRLFDESMVMNLISNLTNSCFVTSPILRKYPIVFRRVVGCVWLVSEFSDFGPFFLGGNPSFYIYVNLDLLAKSVVGANPSEHVDTVVFVHGNSSWLTGSDRKRDEPIEEFQYDGDRKYVTIHIDMRNIPMCAELIRFKYPRSTIILDERVNPEPFFDMSPIVDPLGVCLEDIYEYGNACREVVATLALIDLHRMIVDDPLDAKLRERIVSLYGRRRAWRG